MADITNVPVGNVDEQAYSELVKALKAAKTAGKHLDKARQEQDGVYNSCMAACVTLKSLADCNATLGAVSNDIWFNKDGLAKAVGAEPRDEVSSDGKKYKLPASFSTVKSVITFAFENNVSMIKIDEKGKPVTDPEGNVIPKSYTELRKEKTAVQRQVKAKETEQQVAQLTGVNRARYELGVLLAAVAADISTWDEHRIASARKTFEQFKPKSQAEKLHEANEAAKARALAEKQPRRSRAKKGAKDVAEDLSQAAA